MALSPASHGGSFALLTDLYQLTMACGYWRAGIAEREAVFHLSFRSHPFRGGFSVACGLSRVIDFLSQFHFEPDDLDYLQSLEGDRGAPLFDADFLSCLKHFQFRCTLDAIPEGAVVFPHEPLVRVRGPLWQCQLLETALLNIINFETLIATKAARVALAAQGDPVLEFGLRRAQGVDGGLTASRAAYVGGCAATSNVLAGKLFGIPVKGTHAHSWVMAFHAETDSFDAYAEAMPGNCILLVDTYDTIAGVRRAIETGRKLRERGHELVGIRLDSGDLTTLSCQARDLLDTAGFPAAKIVASGDLDEYAIAALKRSGAKIDIWGVGTKLSTAYDDPALGGIYKLSAMRDTAGAWEHKIKLSEETEKMSTPGILQVRRFRLREKFIADAIYNESTPPVNGCTLVDPSNASHSWAVPADAHGEDLLVPVFRNGELVSRSSSLEISRARLSEQLQRFDEGVTRLENPSAYRVGIEQALHHLKEQTAERTRSTNATDA